MLLLADSILGFKDMDMVPPLLCSNGFLTDEKAIDLPNEGKKLLIKLLIINWFFHRSSY